MTSPTHELGEPPAADSTEVRAASSRELLVRTIEVHDRLDSRTADPDIVAALRARAQRRRLEAWRDATPWTVEPGVAAAVASALSAADRAAASPAEARVWFESLSVRVLTTLDRRRSVITTHPSRRATDRPRA